MKFLNSMTFQVFHDLYSVRTLLYQDSVKKRGQISLQMNNLRGQAF